MRLNRVLFYAGVTVLTLMMIFSVSMLRAGAEGTGGGIFDELEEPEISAKAAIVYNGATGEVLYSKDSTQKLPMASTTKIMSALIVLEQEDRGVDLNEKFTVDSDAVMTEGSSMGLKAGDKVSLYDLCCGMLLPSGNDAANAAAVRVAGSVEGFVEMMNRRARELGLYSTNFVTPSGLDDYTDQHYSTAADMAVLTAEAMKDRRFRDICSQQDIKLCFGDPPFDRWLKNTNRLLRYDDITGVKTGFTDKARRCLVSACMREGCELICVTLNDPDDWQDHRALFDYCFAKVSAQSVSGARVSLNAVGADKDRVSCRAEGIRLTMKNGAAERVKTEIRAEPFVYGPIKTGRKVGEVIYTLDGFEIGRTALRTDEELKAQKARLSLWDRLRVLAGEILTG